MYGNGSWKNMQHLFGRHFLRIQNNQLAAMRIISLSFGFIMKNNRPMGGKRVKFVKEVNYKNEYKLLYEHWF
jgi:hypothetical protein